MGAAQIAIGRIFIGVAAIAAPRLFARVQGFPADNDTPSARAGTRLFGIRDLILGVMILDADEDPTRRRRLYALNAAVDAGDAASFAMPLIRRQGVDRAALFSMVVALGATASWLRLLRD